MKELKDIVRAYDEAVLQGKRSALATVVHVEGSSYRRPGARMLVTEDGDITGAISGGCLEGDALRKARSAIFQQQARLVVYDTTDDDDDLKFGVQLGCNGIVTILFEPIDKEQANNAVWLLKQAVAQRKEAVLVTAFGSGAGTAHTGTCGYLSADEEVWLTDDATIKADAAHFLREKASAVKPYPEQSALYQAVSPAIQLVVAGAGNDAQPLVQLASVLGWEIMVVDGRPTHAAAERFPAAGKVVVSKASQVPAQVRIDAQTAFVLMTHNYHYDLELLSQLIHIPSCPYIGVLGPKKKLERMLDELAGQGMTISDDHRARIYGPAGLDIGAEAAAEIALSIMAEIKACLAGRGGTSLKFRQEGIHEKAR